MRKEVSAPIMAVIVVIFVVAVAAIGWFLINPKGPAVKDTDIKTMGAALPPGAQASGSSGGETVKPSN